jgi:signal transduction histidine kinase
LDEGLVSQTIRKRQPLMIREIPPEEIRTSLSPQYKHWLDKFGLHSILIVPLLVHDHLVGTIGVSRDRPGRPYQEADMLFLQDLADRMALAVQNERLFSKTQQNSQQLTRSNTLITALIQVTGRLLLVLNPHKIVQILCDELKNNQVQSIIALFDPTGQTYVIQKSSIEPDTEDRIRALTGNGVQGVQGLRIPRERISAFFDGQVEQRQAVFIADSLAYALKIYPEVKPEQIEQNLKWIGVSDQTRAISIPMAVDNQLMGFIIVWSDDLREEDLPIFSIFASHTTIALENARLFQQVRSGRERLQAVSRQLVSVQEQERRQIARELHDEIGQILTGLNFLLEMSAAQPVEMVKENIDEARSTVNDLMNKVREISLNLRPAMLDDLGLLPAILWHVNRYTQQTGIHVNLKQYHLSKSRFSPEVETAAYRIIQEALTNVARHAGVNTVDIDIRVNSQTLSIQIDDNGRGFDLSNTLDTYTTSGISGMQERANLVGGKLIIDSSPESGTRLQAILPIGEQRLERRTNDRLNHVSR